MLRKKKKGKARHYKTFVNEWTVTASKVDIFPVYIFVHLMQFLLLNFLTLHLLQKFHCRKISAPNFFSSSSSPAANTKQQHVTAPTTPCIKSSNKKEAAEDEDLINVDCNCHQQRKSGDVIGNSSDLSRVSMTERALK